MSPVRVGAAFCRVLLLAPLGVAPPVFAASPDAHQSGTKYSPLTQINAQNVGKLEKAWEYHTGEVFAKGQKNALVAFEDQPNLIDGNLVVCTVSRRLISRHSWPVPDPRSPSSGPDRTFPPCWRAPPPR